MRDHLRGGSLGASESPKVSPSTREVKVDYLLVQPSRFKPKNLNPVELEVLRLKRAKIGITVKVDDVPSKFLAVLEFRGRTLIVTRRSGSASAAELIIDLSDEYSVRYNEEALLDVDDLSENDDEEAAECECTVVNPEAFLDFLHLLKVRAGFTYSVA